MRRRVLLALAFIPCCVALLTAQAGGSISGTVKDASGGVVPGADVTVTNVTLATQVRIVTDAQGRYSFPRLPVGRYDLLDSARRLQAAEARRAWRWTRTARCR